jgi:predicted DNA-binding transcriptional regulator AlpA
MQFVRKNTFKDRLGIRNSKFHEELKAGRIPPADAWLGSRSPVWLEETVEQTLKQYLAAPKPAETRPLRRRRRLSDTNPSSE